MIAGTTPLVATALLIAGDGPWLIWAYFAVLSAITITATVLTPETLRTGLRRHSDQPVEART